MQKIKKISTGSGIIDSIVGGILIWVIFSLLNVVRSLLSHQSKLSLFEVIRNSLEIGAVWLSGLLAIMMGIMILGIFFKNLYIWIGLKGQNSRNLRRFKSTLLAHHSFVRPALSLSAERTVAHLVAGNLPKREPGIIMSIYDYIEILNSVMEIKDLYHVEIFCLVPPSEWGDENAPDEIQASAWDYLHKQAARKVIDPKSIRIRRHLVLPIDHSWIKKQLEKRDSCYASFESAHVSAKIDLYHLDPRKFISPDGIKDCIFFWNKSGKGWMISDLSSKLRDAQSIMEGRSCGTSNDYCRASIIANADSFLNHCGDFLRTVNAISMRIYEHSSNVWESDFMEKAGLKHCNCA